MDPVLLELVVTGWLTLMGGFIIGFAASGVASSID